MERRSAPRRRKRRFNAGGRTQQPEPQPTTPSSATPTFAGYPPAVRPGKRLRSNSQRQEPATSLSPSAPGEFLAERQAIDDGPSWPRRKDDNGFGPTSKCASRKGRSRTDLPGYPFPVDPNWSRCSPAPYRRCSRSAHTAILCLDWLRTGLSAFARRHAAQASAIRSLRYKRYL